jgi:hypothetical protein
MLTVRFDSPFLRKEWLGSQRSTPPALRIKPPVIRARDSNGKRFYPLREKRCLLGDFPAGARPVGTKLSILNASSFLPLVHVGASLHPFRVGKIKPLPTLHRNDRFQDLSL